ncbi:hypothetical protein QWA68_008259 [Fusarium oxysporum]|nr:hypothetical protein H9L39_11694 [Fusarium oxysporum f. sp. albedinis]KAK2693825.1 hypothetical protein QWA68_008259 [Fusarium oxysporum]
MWGRAKASQGISKFCFALLSAAEDSKVLGDLLASHRQVLQHTKPSLVCRSQGLGSNGPDPNIWFTMIACVLSAFTGRRQGYIHTMQQTQLLVNNLILREGIIRYLD